MLSLIFLLPHHQVINAKLFKDIITELSAVFMNEDIILSSGIKIQKVTFISTFFCCVILLSVISGDSAHIILMMLDAQVPGVCYR